MCQQRKCLRLFLRRRSRQQLFRQRLYFRLLYRLLPNCQQLRLLRFLRLTCQPFHLPFLQHNNRRFSRQRDPLSSQPLLRLSLRSNLPLCLLLLLLLLRQHPHLSNLPLNHLQLSRLLRNYQLRFQPLNRLFLNPLNNQPFLLLSSRLQFLLLPCQRLRLLLRPPFNLPCLLLFPHILDSVNAGVMNSFQAT